LVASVAGTTALHIFRRISSDKLGPLSSGSSFIWTGLILVVPALLALGMFLLIYRFLPSANASFSDLWPGALLATLLSEVLKNGFAFYVAHFNNYNLVYGSLAAVMLFLLWTYLASSILLLGAEFTVQYGRLRRGEYDDLVAKPAGSALTAISRFVRGLFVRAPR
jgi:membrane protein